MMPIKDKQIWSLMDILRGPKAVTLQPETLKGIGQTLQAHKVEIFERPSLNGGPGASEKQLSFQKVFFARNHRIMCASGANQSGKTDLVGGLCFAKWLRDYAMDGDCYWVLARTSQTLRDIPCKTLWNFLPKTMFGETRYTPVSGFGQSHTLILHLPKGGTCELWMWTEEMDIGVVESARLNGVWWTECGREAIFGALQPRLAAKNGFLLMDFVPQEGWHRTLRLKAETGADPDIYYQRFCMADNAHNLAPGEIERQRRKMSSEEAAVRIDGKDAAAFGVVYRAFRPDRHVIEPFLVPHDWPRWRCMDWGYRNPLAHLWVCAMKPGTLLSTGVTVGEAGALAVYREHYQNEWSVESHVISLKTLSEGEEFVDDEVIVDPTIFNVTQANGTTIANAFENAGYPVRPGLRVNKYGEKAMVEEVRHLFENDQLFFFNTCPHSIYEHQVWRVKEYSDGSTAKGEPFEDKNNHSCDALKLLIAESPTFFNSRSDCHDFPASALI